MTIRRMGRLWEVYDGFKLLSTFSELGEARQFVYSANGGAGNVPECDGDNLTLWGDYIVAPRPSGTPARDNFDPTDFLE